MQLIDGKSLAAQIREGVKEEVKDAGFSPKLAALLVGDDEGSHMYVKMKGKVAAEIGVRTDIRTFDADVTDEELLAVIEEWNKDEDVDAILIQVPLPPGHDTNRLIDAIDPRKDVDGFHPKTVERMYAGESKILSPVHEAVLRLIATTGISINTKKSVIIANSEIFSKPLEYLFKKTGMFVQAFSPTDLDREALKDADIVAIAVGRPNFLKMEDLKTGACVIDVGTNRLPDRKVAGDVDKDSVKNLDGWLSPVPGGVGPMTIALLLRNVLTLAKLRRGIEE